MPSSFPAGSAVPAVCLAHVTALLLYLGYRLRVRGEVWFVAGYRPGRVPDPAGLARAMGDFVLTLGAAMLVATVAAVPGVRARVLAGGVAVVVAVAAAAALAHEARRCLRSGSRPTA